MTECVRWGSNVFEYFLLECVMFTLENCFLISNTANWICSFQKSKCFDKVLMVVGYLLIKSNGSLLTKAGKLQGKIAISQERDFDEFWFSKKVFQGTFKKTPPL